MTQKTLDRISLKITDQVFAQWNLDYHLGSTHSNFSKLIKLKGLEFEIDATLYFDKVEDQPIEGFISFDSTGADSRDFDDEGNSQTPFIIIDFGIETSWLPQYFTELYAHLVDVVRHEVEHITQGGESIGNYIPGKPSGDDSMERELIHQGFLPQSTYLILPKEVDANLEGLRLESQVRGEKMINTLNRYLDTQNLAQEERDNVVNLWRNRAKKIGKIPQF
jgi:predicted XRE-type DNA-binding protein